MNHSKIRSLMMQFSKIQLESYLNEDFLKTLVEWNNDDALFTKAKLSEMIITINGLSILQSENFRKELLKRFTEDKLKEFKSLLPNKYHDCNDLYKLVDIISHQKWKASKVTELFLKDLGYDLSDVFDDYKKNNSSIIELKSNDRFYELLDYQYIIRQQVLTKLTDGEVLNRMLIHMPTGTGKTKTAMHIISHYYNYNLNKTGLILWIAHTKELLDQAYDTFVNVWSNIGNGNVNVYRNYDLYKINNIDIDLDLNGLMICSIQGLIELQKTHNRLFEKIRTDIRLLIFDEAHKASAPEYRKIIEDLMTRKNGLQDRALIGLSATPGRTNSDSVDNVLLKTMFDNFSIEIDTRLINELNYSHSKAINMKSEKDIIKYFQDRGVLSKIKKEELIYDEDISIEELNKIKIVSKTNGYNDFSDNSLNIIARNKSRNLRILQRLFELNNQKIPTIVFACSVKHAQILSAMLSINGVKNVCIFGSMPSNERKKSIEKFKDRSNDCNVIINYEVLTTGFDSTNIKCVFITRPTSSIVLYSQMIGRGLRGPQMGGNEECLLIDIKDNLGKYNENMAFSHFNSYWGGR